MYGGGQGYGGGYYASGGIPPYGAPLPMGTMHPPMGMGVPMHPANGEFEATGGYMQGTPGASPYMQPGQQPKPRQTEQPPPTDEEQVGSAAASMTTDWPSRSTFLSCRAGMARGSDGQG